MTCRSIFLDTECFESIEAQKKRYEMHNNSLEDEGYRTFLEGFIKPVLQEVLSAQKENKDCERKEKPYKGESSLWSGKILDYGSGPEPALCGLMQRYAHKNEYLSEHCEIRGWDPFFAPDTPFYEDGADLITCLEVAEHFETPLEDMKKLASKCRPGGYVAVGTMLLPYEKEMSEYDEKKAWDTFKKWWYRSDSTHVAFYTMEGLKCCAEKSGLTFMKAVTDRAFLFRKELLS